MFAFYIVEYSALLPCRCYVLLLHKLGELMVIYCRLYTD